MAARCSLTECPDRRTELNSRVAAFGRLERAGGHRVAKHNAPSYLIHTHWRWPQNIRSDQIPGAARMDGASKKKMFVFISPFWGGTMYGRVENSHRKQRAWDDGPNERSNGHTNTPQNNQPTLRTNWNSSFVFSGKVRKYPNRVELSDSLGGREGQEGMWPKC